MMFKTKMTAEQASKMFPVGTWVKFYPIMGDDHFEETIVKSEAWALGHGEIVPKVSGRAGGVCVSHLEYL